MKTFGKILMVTLILVFVAVAVLGFLEMPVAPENGELSEAQKFIVTLKTHLSTILAAIGLPLDAVLLGLFAAINKQAAAFTNKAGVTSGEVEEIKKNQQAQQNRLETANRSVDSLVRKLDILSEMMSETLLMSDMPSSLRERIKEFALRYESVKTEEKNTISDVSESGSAEETVSGEKIAEEIKNAVETAEAVYNSVKETVSRF